MTPHDTELDRLGLLLISVIAVTAVSGLVALMSNGMTWLMPVGLLVSLTSVAALMWMFSRITGSDDENGRADS